MTITEYFDTDDGSLPEIEVTFGTSEGVSRSFAYLLRIGGKAERARSEPKQPFHVVLTGLVFEGHRIPDLGVFVSPDGLVLDYRMGPQWGLVERHALMAMLRRLQELGGSVSVRNWWGAEGDRVFQAELARR